MEIKFPPFADRHNVALLLEAPVRVGDREAIRTVLDELDRIDAVSAAEVRLRVAREEWREAVIAERVKIEPAEKGTNCFKQNYSGYHGRGSKAHAAKVRLNGLGYCGTHLKNAQYSAAYAAVRDAGLFVGDPVDEAIVAADKAVREARRAEA